MTKILFDKNASKSTKVFGSKVSKISKSYHTIRDVIKEGENIRKVQGTYTYKKNITNTTQGNEIGWSNGYGD